jgi:hypothetical protein
MDDPKSYAIKKAARSVNQDAKDMAESANMYEEEDFSVDKSDRMKLLEASDKLQRISDWGWIDRSSLKFWVQFTHKPTLSPFYISFFNEWYVAEINYCFRRHLVVGSQNQEEFLRKLQEFSATLPRCTL